MGCIISTSKDEGGTKKKPGQGGEMFVFVPGLRIPKSIDFDKSLQGYLSVKMVEHLSALRTRIVAMATGEGPARERQQHNMVRILHDFVMEKLILYC